MQQPDLLGIFVAPLEKGRIEKWIGIRGLKKEWAQAQSFGENSKEGIE
jgi:hypothetical protein